MVAQDDPTGKVEYFRWVRQHPRIGDPLGPEGWARWVFQDGRGYVSTVTYIPLALEDAIDRHFAMERADCVRADRESYGP